MLSEAPSAKEVKLAKSLVHPEKAVRDKTFLTIKSYAASIVEIDDLDMLKLWKALYYCMWLADKQAVQMELASELANLSDHFRNTEVQMKYFTLFFRIMLREWSFLDQYRVNKFYSLIRIMLNKLFTLLKQANWNESNITQMVEMLQQEVLTKTPNGIRYHLADIYLPELLKVTDGSIDTNTFDKLLLPFYQAMVRVDDSTFIERVHRSVFNDFAENFCAEAASEEDSDKKVFSNVNTKFVQKRVFDLASDENTNERFRKKLYDLHKVFAQKTRVQFITDEMLEEGNSKTVAKEGKKTEKVKAKKEKRPIEEEPKEIPAPPAKKAKATEEVVQQKAKPAEVVQPPKAVVEAPVSKKTEEKKSKKKEEHVKQVEQKPVVAEAKKAAPVEAAAPAQEKADFIAAKKFEGAKSGYAFKKVR